VSDLGKLLILCGAVIAVIGVVLVLAGRAHLPLGRLPGDIVYRGKNTTVYFPLVTSIIISIVLSVVLYMVSRFSR
jgi:predicted tellurium resistance membrane protein TerC